MLFAIAGGKKLLARPISSLNMRDVCLGRQAIYDRKRRVVGWELLFRTADGVRVGLKDGTQATAQTLLSSIVEIGLERITDAGEPVYLNCTREFLNQPPLLPPDRCVLEVLEDISMDDSLLAALDHLRDQGYQIALDDFVYEPRLAPLAKREHIVKGDVLALGLAGLESQVRQLLPFGVTLLAEKIDSEKEFEACKRMGFDLFQGYYLRRPDTLTAKGAQTNKLSALVLLSECHKDDADLTKVARILSSDPGLSYKTLQLANGTLFQVHTPIASIPQAVAVIGLDALARWSTLLMLAGLSDCPPSYLERALERGRMCELLARQTGLAEQSAYLAGLLSILDSAMGVPLKDLAPRLPLSGEIRAALSDRSGSLGNLLEAVTSYEAGRPVPGPAPVATMERCFWESCEYARQTSTLLGLKNSA
ncbi:MAG: HDOD domain-containing protein [Acidobacteria bacterium]|nr:HDOD domain-containing protein [Acidobacteriota bacterium]